ncbi:hypothetical protein K469DRAFT_349439 [Zopfia rhizophila CBS 207.26]|uniref:Uncharacterized protein n=1 Tax=Zopfia rhizophila CBS 207.26 TaxID=1314779 RepID=A0A6A6DIU3_9PEZI|nr:hypothetical protein K469DRAFT_349439 [Zopfia rhizophila CBS 207.26]
MAQSGLVAVLSSFNNLAEQEKIAAIQYILQDADRQRPSTSTSSTRHSASSGDSHTCSHCKGLTVINEGQAFVRGTRQHFASLYFSKEKLVQGLVNKCLLVEWIFRLLSRGLMKLKSDISDKNIHIPKARPNDSLGSVADDLDYLSTQTGVAVQAIVNQGSGRLLITYDVEPFLLDQLWDASHDVDQFVNYQQFIGKYAGHVTAYPFQVFTTHGE